MLVLWYAAGLLANLTCVQAELYEMEAGLSVREDPLWVVPYSTVAQEYRDLLDDFTAYAAACPYCLCQRQVLKAVVLLACHAAL